MIISGIRASQVHFFLIPINKTDNSNKQNVCDKKLKHKKRERERKRKKK